MSARHIAVIASLASCAALGACSSEVVVQPSEDGGGGGSAPAGGGGDGGGEALTFPCDDMCSEWIAKFPHCYVESCLGFCNGKLAEGEANGCLPEAIACLDRWLIDSTGCSGGCNNWQLYVDCTQQ